METNKVISFFDDICKIPRESGHEENIITFLQLFAKKRNLECKTDEAGNVVIIKEASKGMESSPSIVLQSHSDMVCEKNSDSNHDFTKDPIKYVIEDGWLIAKETTLGADCGIGIAAQLAILDDKNLIHPKIEALFTTEEEIGLNGAKALKPGFISSKYLINLDSEDEGEIFIGCAGGIDTTAKFPYKSVKVDPNHSFLKASFFGGTGGHSGDDINKNRSNANQLIARFLFAINNKYSISLCSIDGGNKRNAIAREASAVFAFDKKHKEEIKNIFFSLVDDVKNEFAKSDPALKGSIVDALTVEHCIDSNCASRLIYALNGCPHGVLAMSQDIPDFVETSTNLASIKMLEEGVITVCTNQRSSINSARYNAANRIESVFTIAGAQVTHESEYPGWKPNIDSYLLKVSRESYKELFKVEPIVRAIHAGLECGMFANTYPGLDMISFGPTLRGVHAPGEKLEIASVEKFWKLLLHIVKNIK